MPLIPCPDCDKDVSDRAQYCPHCGYPIREYVQHMVHVRKERQARLEERQRLRRNVRNITIFAGIVILLVFVLLILPLLLK